MAGRVEAAAAGGRDALLGLRPLAVITGGGAWSVAQWMTVFSAAYLVNLDTSSPLVTELTGVAFFLPMLVAGGLSGVISDKGDRARICYWTLVAMASLSLFLGLGGLNVSQQLYLPLLFAYVVAVGFSLAINTAARRVLLSDMVPALNVTRTLAIDAIGMNSGNLLGPLIGGLVLAGAAATRNFVVLGILFLVAAAFVNPVVARRPLGQEAATCNATPAKPACRRLAPTAHQREDDGDDVTPAETRPGLLEQMHRMLREHPALAGVVSVTAIMNFCYFPLFSAVPLLGGRLHIGASELGVLGALPGLGMITSAAVASWSNPVRPAISYLAGCFVAFAGLLGAAFATTFAATALALFVSGIGAGLFAAFQAALVVRSVGSAFRGRAMGVMNTAIGSMTGGLLLAGFVASKSGVSAAIAILALMGFASLGGCTTAWRRLWAVM